MSAIGAEAGQKLASLTKLSGEYSAGLALCLPLWGTGLLCPVSRIPSVLGFSEVPPWLLEL